MTIDSRTAKLIRMLGSSADAEVLTAARNLVSELQADGFDLNALAAAWEIEREKKRGPRPILLSPVDWVEVGAAITRYALGKTTVDTEAVLRAVLTTVPIDGLQWLPGYGGLVPLVPGPGVLLHGTHPLDNATASGA